MGPRTVLAAAALALLALVAAPAGPAAAACPATTALPKAVSMGDYEASILCLVNGQRLINGLPPFRTSTKLENAATGHSISMRRNHYFSHDSPGGGTMTSRIAAQGYLRGAKAWFIGENIAWGSGPLGTPQTVVANWMASPEHRDNILDPHFREIGVGASWGSPSPSGLAAATVTTDFGGRKG